MMTMQKLIIPPFSLISLLHGHNIHEKKTPLRMLDLRDIKIKRNLFLDNYCNSTIPVNIFPIM